MRSSVQRIFRAEIVWVRTSAHSDSASYGQVHDSILFYTQSESFTWNHPKTKYEQWYVERYYRYKDEDGRRFMSDNLSAKGLSGGGYEYTWKGCDGLWRCPESRMAELDAKGRIYYTVEWTCPATSGSLRRWKAAPFNRSGTTSSP